MTKLRQQLDTACDAYQQTRYPGHLAADITPPPLPHRFPWRSIGFITAAAAVVLIMIGLPRGPEITPVPPRTARTSAKLDIPKLTTADLPVLKQATISTRRMAMKLPGRRAMPTKSLKFRSPQTKTAQEKTSCMPRIANSGSAPA